MDDDLFSINKRIEIQELTISVTERTVRDYWIVLDGTRFDAKDVYETLSETCDYSSESYMTDRKMIDALISLRVIEHGGSGRWMISPEKGPNYDLFINRLRELLGDHY